MSKKKVKVKDTLKDLRAKSVADFIKKFESLKRVKKSCVNE